MHRLPKPAVVVFIALAFLWAAPACSQPDSTKGSASGVTVQGKFVYLDRIASYMLKGERPMGEWIVVNPDPAVMDELVKSGKSVTVEGYLSGGADRLRIERIDGKPSPGTPVESSKPSGETPQ
jgi:hypothetical protein